MNNSKKIRVIPSALSGGLQLPPSKSMAHRMLIGAALAEGRSQITRLESSQDIQATCRALSALGAGVQLENSTATVRGLAMPPSGWQPTGQADCGESGSTLRFLIPLFALCGKPATLTGAARLFERPLTVYEDIFKNQGLVFQPGPGCLQLQGPLAGGDFTLPGNVSSQFISGLLFALPLLEETSRIRVLPPFESRDYVELTRAAQALFGVASHWEDENTLHIPGGQRYQPASTAVEGDWSQAGVGAVLGAVKGPLLLENLREDSHQGDRVILELVRRCGAVVTKEGNAFRVAPGNRPLHSPGTIDLSACPDLGPILCTLALFCQGQTRIVNAGRLRIKESDRIASVESELRKLGGRVTSTPDSMTIEGGVPLHGGATLSHNDHRVVMALTAAAVCGGVPVEIDGAEAVAKSWPGFFEDMNRLGVQTEEL